MKNTPRVLFTGAHHKEIEAGCPNPRIFSYKTLTFHKKRFFPLFCMPFIAFLSFRFYNMSEQL